MEEKKPPRLVWEYGDRVSEGWIDVIPRVLLFALSARDLRGLSAPRAPKRGPLPPTTVAVLTVSTINLPMYPYQLFEKVWISMGSASARAFLY